MRISDWSSDVCSSDLAAHGDGARRRDHRARRSARRAAPPRHREADRIQELSAGAALFRPARLLLAARHGAQLCPRDREIARPRGAGPRAISAPPASRADPYLQSTATHRAIGWTSVREKEGANG